MAIEHSAFVVFVAIVCVIYYRVVFATRDYADRLRLLRNVCHTAMQQYEQGDKTMPRKTEPYHLIVEKKSGDIVWSSPDIDIDTTDLLRLTKQIETRQLSFQHAPDMENTSHIIALYKDETQDSMCVAFMNT